MVVILIFPLASDITAPLSPSPPTPTVQHQQQPRSSSVQPSPSSQPQRTNPSNVCDQRKFYYYGDTIHRTKSVQSNNSHVSRNHIVRSNGTHGLRKPHKLATTEAQKSKAPHISNNIRHVSRVNISDVYSQIEVDGDVEPVTKEGKFNRMVVTGFFFYHFLLVKFNNNTEYLNKSPCISNNNIVRYSCGINKKVVAFRHLHKI